MPTVSVPSLSGLPQNPSPLGSMPDYNNLPQLNTYNPQAMTPRSLPEGVFYAQKRAAMEGNLSQASSDSQNAQSSFSLPPSPPSQASAAPSAMRVSDLLQPGLNVLSGGSNSIASSPAPVDLPQGGSSLIPKAYAASPVSDTKLTSADIQDELRHNDPMTVSQKAQLMDSGYKNFTDYYKTGGGMAQLPQVFQKNFDQFALNSYYMGRASNETVSDRQALGLRPDLMPDASGRQPLQTPALPDTIQGKAASLLRTFPTTLALGAKLMINDYQKMLGIPSFNPDGTTTPAGKSDKQIIEEHRALLQDQGSSLTPETALYWASKEMKIGAAFASKYHPALGAFIGGLGGLGETTALGAMGQPVDWRDYASNITASAAAPAIAGAAADALSPTGIAGHFISQSSWIGRIASTALMGGAGSVGFGATEGVANQAADRGTTVDTLQKMGNYGKYGLLFGGLFGAGNEIWKSLPIAANKLASNAANSTETNWKEAVANDPEAETPLRHGIDPIFVRHAQDSSIDDLSGYKEQIDITRQKMGDFGGTENVKRSVGEKIIDAINTVFKTKEEAGAALGAMREQLPTDAVVPAEQVEKGFMKLLSEKGVSIDDKGELSNTFNILTDQEFGQIRFLWNKMPDGDYSAQTLDVLRQNINDILNKMPGGRDSILAPALMELKNSATEAITPLAPEAYLKEMARYSEASKVIDDATVQLKIPNEATHSASTLKANLGERDLRAGEIANRLLTNSAGKTEPFMDHLEAFAHSQGWDWGGNIRNQAAFARFIERLTGTQQAGSLEGITTSTGENMTLMGMGKKAASAASAQLQATKFSKLDAIDSYIQSLIDRNWQGSPDLQAAHSLFNDTSEQHPLSAGFLKTRPGFISVPASNSPNAISDNGTDNMPLSQFSPNGVADAKAAQTILDKGGTLDEAMGVSNQRVAQDAPIDMGKADMEQAQSLAGPKGHVAQVNVPLKDINFEDRGYGPSKVEGNTFKTGDSLPPPILSYEKGSGKYAVLDGNHRLTYLSQQGINSVPSLVINRGMEDASTPESFVQSLLKSLKKK